MHSNAAARAHIMVVDDDRLVLASLARGLREAGYEVSEASSGADALDIARGRRPDLALLDVRMPEMSGIELGRLLRENMGVPFLYLSAYGQDDIVKAATAYGALGYLVKPLDIPQILPSLEAALSRSAEINELRDAKAQLNAALSGTREISVAIGVLMEHGRLDHDAAFEMLRNHARAHRRKLQDVAQEIIHGAETINRVLQAKPED
jgi:response regulator NasT